MLIYYAQIEDKLTLNIELKYNRHGLPKDRLFVILQGVLSDQSISHCNILSRTSTINIFSRTIKR